jgi:hypothetical protein
LLAVGLVLPAQAAERSGLVQRASCAVIRFYLAKYSASATEMWARGQGGRDLSGAALSQGRARPSCAGGGRRGNRLLAAEATDPAYPRRGIRMTDQRFYLLLALLLFALAGGEIAYGVFGPLSASTHQIDEFSSSNRAR